MTSPSDRRAHAWTTEVWAAHLPRETDPAWISAWLAREKRRRVRRLMRQRLTEIAAGGVTQSCAIQRSVAA